MKFTEMSTQREERSIHARITVASLTGSQASSSSAIPEGYTQLSAAKTATGVYVINFLRAFVRTPVVLPIALTAAAKLFLTVGAVSATSVTINCWNDAGTATDTTGLLLTITGFDVADQV